MVVPVIDEQLFNSSSQQSIISTHRRTTMKTKSNTKAGGIHGTNHNQSMKVKTNLKAGDGLDKKAGNKPVSHDLKTNTI
jgi:hypothetical protein